MPMKLSDEQAQEAIAILEESKRGGGQWEIERDALLAAVRPVDPVKIMDEFMGHINGGHAITATEWRKAAPAWSTIKQQLSARPALDERELIARAFEDATLVEAMVSGDQTLSWSQRVAANIRSGRHRKSP